MKLKELKNKLPEKFHPWVDEYGQVFLDMATEDIKAWIDLIANGDVGKAYGEILKRKDPKGVIHDWSTINDAWADANAAQKQRLEVMESAAYSILKILLPIAFAAVGF